MNGLELDRDEFATVLMLLSATRVFGLAEVLPADPAARERAFAAGIDRLRARGLITGRAPDQAIPDTGLMRLASVVVDPRLVIVAERAASSDAALHFADDDGYVSLEGDAVSGFRLGWVEDTTLLARRVLRFIGGEPGQVSRAEPFALTETAFSGAREMTRAAGPAAAESTLRDAGLAPELARAVAVVLTPETGGHVLAIRLNAGQAEAARRAWVLSAGGSEGWLGWRPSADATRLRFEPLDAAHLAEVLDRFAQDLAPARA